MTKAVFHDRRTDRPEKADRRVARKNKALRRAYFA